MSFQLSVACGCNVGKVRKNNEDNFYLNGKSLAASNAGLKSVLAAKFSSETKPCFAVFDGMGGEEAGEVASFSAVQELKRCRDNGGSQGRSPRDFLLHACERMNLAVCREMDKLPFGRMGTTAAMLCFSGDKMYSCNLGDSRIYRLRGEALLQLSTDDVEWLPEEVRHKRKAPLTQYLGVYPDELTLVPHIEEGRMQSGDIYLACSDGLTDMLSDDEIRLCLKQHASVRRSVEHLIGEALRKGGKDNVTVMVLKVQ